MDDWDKFTSWFFTEIIGLWIIWSSYMAIKFITEVGQHQQAAFSVLGNTQVGALIGIPIICSTIYSIVSAVFWASQK
jgi:hypothetical protein